MQSWCRLIGFLTGMTVVGGWGYFELLDAYRDASERMLSSVEELKLSTQAVSNTLHLQRSHNAPRLSGTSFSPSCTRCTSRRTFAPQPAAPPAHPPLLPFQQMTGHLARIEKVEQTLSELKTSAARAKDVDSMRTEFRKLVEAEHLDVSSPRDAATSVTDADSRVSRSRCVQLLDVKAHVS